jgi:hypothetical protein
MGQRSGFAAGFIWGTGRVGYGPRRLSHIVKAAGGNLEASLPQRKPTQQST